MRKSLTYLLHSGKNSKALYYLQAYCWQLIPESINRIVGQKLLAELHQRADYPELKRLIDYYCQLSMPPPLPHDAPTFASFAPPREGKVYYFDSQYIYRHFPPNLHWQIYPGDITFVPQVPAIVKSRPLVPDNINSVLLPLDKVRHLLFVNDTIDWANKKDCAIFRGKMTGKRERIDFMNKYFGSDICDCGDVSRPSADVLPQWRKPLMPIDEHLKYRYIIALEGNDVASNLKWVMSSNSIAVMPRPTCESWFMEGTLQPNHHYIEIKPDYSDLPERIAYYNEHPNEAKCIIENAHRFVAPFRDAHLQRLIAIGVMEKYLAMTQSYTN